MAKNRKPDQKLKRILDILICMFAMPIALPLSLLITMLIKLEEPGGEVIYRQERIGKDGKRFLLYKFRSMAPNADAILRHYLAENPVLADEWARSQKLKKDPRLTRVGDILRKTSLDELPQIFNILRGDMTLVGPRPIVESETVKYGRYYGEYCDAKPGLTGLWQTSGRNDTTYTQRVAYDHYYLNNWSIWLDLWIIAKTVPTVLTGRGAY